MKKIKQIMLILFILIGITNFAQNNTVKNVLPPAEQPKSGSIKDLNALEREKIQQIEIKKTDNSIIKNQNTNPDEFSSQPIVKGKTTTNKVEDKSDKKTSSSTKKEDKKEEKKETIIKKEVVVKDTINKVTKKKDDAKEIKSNKSTKNNDEFSSMPIIKNKNVVKSTVQEIKKEPTAEIKKYNKIDTTKSLKDFYFETTPITNSTNKPSYNLPNPRKEDKEILEAKIPVNSKSSVK